MYAVEKLSSYISRGVYTVAGPFHPFGGAVDIIVVQQQDGSFKSSPWYIKFGKFQGVLKTKEKVVNINVNGVDAGFHMYLDSKGEAYFLKELESGGDIVFASPPSSVYEIDEESQNGRMKKSRSCDLGADQPNSVTEIDVGSRKIVMETNSNRSQIFGFMYGEKSLDDTGLVEEGGAGVKRESSVERAEIAANLLEVNWSTNLSTPKRRMNNDSRLSVSNVSAEESYKDSEVNIPVSGNMDRSNEVSSPKSLSRRPQEQDIEITTLEKNVFNEVLSETVIRIREFDVGNADTEMREKANMQYGIEQSSVERDGPSSSSVYEEETGTSCTHTETLETSGTASDLPGEKNLENENLPHSKFEELHAHPVFQCEEADAIKMNTQVESGSSDVLSTEENLNGFNSLNEDDSCEFLNTKTIHESKVIPVTRETNSPLVLIHSVTSDSDGSEVVEVIHEETKLEKLTPKKSLAAEQVEDPSTKFPSTCLSYSCTCGKCKVAIEELSTTVVPHVQVVSVNRMVGSIVEADSTCFSYSCTCGKCKVAIEEPSTKVVPHVQVVSVNRLVGSIVEADSTCFSYSCTCGNCKVAIEEPSTIVVPHVQVASVDRMVGSIVEADSTCFSYSCTCGNCKVAIEEPSTIVVPHVQVVSVDRMVGSIEEAELIPSLEFNGVPEKLGLDCPHSKLSSSSIVTTESLEEDQVLFGDNDDSLTSGAESKDYISTDPAKIENHSLFTLNDIEASSDIHESCLSSDKFAQGCSSKAFNPLIEESNTSSSPKSILRSPKGAEEEVEGLIQSLPILRSHIDNLEAPHVLNPLSHSLGSSSEKLKRSLGRRDITSPLKFESDSEHHLQQVDPSVDLRSLKKLKDMSANSMIEISLCKHLLYEGMGVDAASQAFDAEKLEVENFVSPASDLVKDDRIVVRIGGQYLPWEVAAPVILEMVSFGQEQNFDLKGVITVDRIEKSLEGDAPGTIESPGGSWKLWPFTFSRSKSMNFVREAPNDTKLSDAENASSSNIGLPKSKTLPKVMVVKKKVKSIVPTSEQLITLNLKEGQNVVTFTFSTAMLGKQQVDARIYLWKWNTRIVISDVDGTITKSDVLGQFMPLVGKDWSQTGVAPLFSAIKENGYQLLFLSARSISQAYITRQFLLNLRQDGKALPSGPVVISPDGLFPSLFREVIRRAPHEFKIACLNDIKALFPPDCNPFYAGFGNRDTDEFSYLKVGIPKGKIFIINPKGEVAVNRRIDTKSYTSIHALVNGMFPPISSAEQEEFNSWNFWRTPLTDINI